MNARADFPMGLVYDLANEAYHAGAGISNSGLALIAKSPAHYFGLKLDPKRPAPTEKAGQLEGTLAHCAILEPGEFETRYAVLPADAPRRPTDAQWNAKKPSPDSMSAMDWWSAWNETNSGRKVITYEQQMAAYAQASSLRALPDVAALLAVGRPEVSAYWLDEKTGELCRARPDWVHPVNDDSVILLDVKTYSDASPREFSRQVARKGYHLQDAFYSDGYAIASGKKVLGFVFAAVETAYPYAACACMLDDQGREVGRAEYRRLLDRYAKCKSTDTWPGYSQAVELISLPAWAAVPVITEEETAV